jgi:hypothetical protein
MSMHRNTWIVGAALLFGVFGLFELTRSGDAREKHEPLKLDGSPIQWRTDLASAQAEAREKDQAMMVLFRCEP